MGWFTKSNTDNFLTWQKAIGTLPLSQLQKYGVDGCDECRFIYSVTVTASETISLPMVSTDDSLYNFIVDFGDGGGDKFVTAYSDANRENTYSVSGTYTITISGVFDYIKFVDSPTSLIEIKQFGDAAIGASSFSGCSNFTIISATDTPSVYQTSLAGLFLNCTSFNGNISMINTYTVTSMASMFSGCAVFNQPVSTLDLSSVTTTSSMFSGCTTFNQTTTSFNTPLVIDMSFMFLGCTLFENGGFDISYDTSLVLNMEGMFQNTTNFDQSVEDFNVDSLTDADDMFANSGFGNDNYDLLLIGWSDSQNIENNVAFRTEATYSLGGSAEAGREYLVDDRFWSIIDGGGI